MPKNNAHAVASLIISIGLVAIPVKLLSAAASAEKTSLDVRGSNPAQSDERRAARRASVEKLRKAARR